MAAKRREMINQPLERIWPDLARAAVAAMPVSEPGVSEALVILDAKISALKKIGGWQTAEHRVNEIDIVIGYLIGAREEIAALLPAPEAQP